MKSVLTSFLTKLKAVLKTLVKKQKSVNLSQDSLRTEDLPLPSGFKFSKRSLDRMRGVHPDLVAVMRKALDYSTVDFAVTEGLRTVERQARLLADGKSTTMNSRHLTGHAVDVMAYTEGGKGTWDWDYYESIAVAVKQASKDLDVMIVWGGDWVTFKDGVHFELDAHHYE